MKNMKYCLIALLLMIINIYPVYAECTNEEIANLKKEADKIEITYKHLGEVTKEDGSKVYNEFMVTARNIPDNIYVHLFPMTTESFVEENGELKIKLTTGAWTYKLYSSQCEDYIDSIEVKLPTFNEYSLDPLCKGVDGNDFKLCGKYYESTVTREIFERRVNLYRRQHNIGIINSEEKEKNSSILKDALNFITKYKIYAIIIVSTIILVIVGIIVFSRNRKRKILQ